MALRIISSASLLDGRLGANPPSSPTLVLWPSLLSKFLSACYISAPARSASEKLFTPTGITINSWISAEFEACLPPFRILNMGTGRLTGQLSARYFHSAPLGLLVLAAALATANDTANTALAPKLLLSSVPSSSFRAESIDA